MKLRKVSMKWKSWRISRVPSSTLLQEEDWSRIRILYWNLLARVQEFEEWSILYERFTGFSGCWINSQWKFRRCQSTSVTPTSSSSWRNAKSFCRNVVYGFSRTSSEILGWLQEFTENLVDDEVPEHRLTRQFFSGTIFRAHIRETWGFGKAQCLYSFPWRPKLRNLSEDRNYRAQDAMTERYLVLKMLVIC